MIVPRLAPLFSRVSLSDGIRSPGRRTPRSISRLSARTICSYRYFSDLSHTCASRKRVQQRHLLQLEKCVTDSVYYASVPVASDIRRPGWKERTEEVDMPHIETKDGVQIFYKDWGTGKPIGFHHGWPLGAYDWDSQMLFFAQRGYRVIGIDRRGHGRSSQVSSGHDMDHYAADAAAVVDHLALRDAIHIGHSTGGGEVTRY